MPGRRRLPRSAPHEQGVSARGISAFLDSVTRDGPELHSLMVLRHGVVVAEGWWAPYRPDVGHELFSLTKAFTSTAVGFAQSEGHLTVDDLVLDHLRDLAPARPDPRLARMRLRHLLTMTSGWAEGLHEGLYDLADWERTILSRPVEHAPGTQFAYTSAASYLLAVVVQRRTGEPLRTYLAPRLFEPLGIDPGPWDTSPSGVDNGGFGLSATTEDVARLGRLYLDGGRWAGRQVLPEGWAQEATRRQVSSHLGEIDWAQGYGYQFWRCRHGAVRADGAFGQFAVVLPEQDAVVAITSGTPDLQSVLDRVWEHLLLALSGTEGAGTDGPAAEEALAARLGALRLAPPAGEPPARGPLAGRTVVFDPNPAGVQAVTVGLDAAQVRVGERTWVVPVGHGEWAEGRLPFGGREWPAAGAAAWVAPDTCVAQVRWYDSPSCLTIRATVGGTAVRASARLNVSFRASTDLGEMTGVVG